MNIKEIVDKIEKVKPYDKGTDVMWTNKHISKYLLEAHINPDTNVASRKASSIEKILNWIISESNQECKTILDLGCGPGLYAKRLAEKGFSVTGMDFSQNSIDYAKKEAENSNLDIKYICKNYLELDFEDKFHLIIMIYCDFGVLSFDEREILVSKIYKALKPGGTFIFDALNEKSLKKLNFSKQWEMAESGFWSEEPYLCLSESLHFPEHKAMLDQHVVFDKKNDYKLYRFWNHYFNINDISKIFKKFNINDIKEYNNILENDGTYNDEGTSFYKVKK